MRLIDVRTEAGLSQAELAKRLHKPQSFVSKIEAGDRRMDVAEYVMWMLALDSDPSTLINALATDLDRSRNRRVLTTRST